jgi:predicted amino acid-binding ACT domain protein
MDTFRLAMHELNIVDIEMAACGFGRGERMLVDVDADKTDIRVLQRRSEREAPFVPETDI